MPTSDTVPYSPSPGFDPPSPEAPSKAVEPLADDYPARYPSLSMGVPSYVYVGEIQT